MPREYMDEKIRLIINQANQQATINNQNIYEGITIKGEHYDFHEMAFFEDRLRIQIPTNFSDMSEQLAKIKYPFGERPPIIKTDSSGDINITLNLIPNNITSKSIPDIKNQIKKFYKRMNPSFLFFEEGIETVGDRPIGFFEFKSPTFNDPLYNLLFIVEIDRNVLIGIFNCPYKVHVYWQPIARQIMRSVKIPNQQTGEMPL